MKNLLHRSMNIDRDIRFIRRLWIILETLAAYGFREIAGACFPDVDYARKYRCRKRSGISKLKRPVQFRMMLEELGPSFVKLGQILSTRPDLIGPEWADELKLLTEHVTAFKFSEVKKIIAEETGKELDEIFSFLDETPLAAASIGQVHRGVLRQNGREIVIKVRRPGAADTIHLDLEIMRFIAQRIEKYNVLPPQMRIMEIVDEFAYSLKRELDYMVEAANLTRFAAEQKEFPAIRVPEVFFEYTTSSIMTMEYIRGNSASRIQQDPELRKQYDLKALAANGVNAFFNQIFVAGFFHADPHPGNLIITDDGRICFIDFGMMGRIGPAERKIFLQALECMLKNDITGMVDLALKMTVSSEFTGTRAALERDAAGLVDANINLPLERLSIARILRELMQLLQDHGLALRPDLYLMFKALITIEQLGRDFDPQLKIVDMLKPFLLRVKIQALDPSKVLQRFINELGENISCLQDLPQTVCSVIRKVDNGELSFNVEHHRLNEIEETLYLTGERLSRSLLLTALFLGSALIIVAKIPPLWNGIPLLGMGGFCISGILSVYALWSDHRQRLKFLKERAELKLAQELRKRKY